jgi:hypothetical protein
MSRQTILRAFKSSRRHGPGRQRMNIEEFATREERNDRFQRLRSGGTKNVSRFTVSRATGKHDAKGRETGKIVWFVVHR